MPLVIPNLSGTRIEVLSVCAHVEVSDEQRAKWFEDVNERELDFETVLGIAEHRIYLGVSKNAAKHGHFHLNLAIRAKLDDGVLGDQSGSIEELQEMFAQVRDCQAKLTVIGNFDLPLSDLPEHGFVKELLRVSTSFADVQVALSGVELSLKGGPDRRIRWSCRGDNLRGACESRFEWNLTDDYLVRTVKSVESSIDRFLVEAT
jgi:hypothetical protein